MHAGDDLSVSREELFPWRRAESLHDSLVLWIPCSFLNMPESQRAWLTLFLDRWFSMLNSEHGLSEEFFMQMDTLQKDKELADKFNANLLREQPLMGHSISSLHGQPKSAPADVEIDRITTGKVKFDYHAMATPRACWFRGSDTAALRATYMGFGGMAILLLPRLEEDQSRLKPMQQLISRLRLPAFLRDEPNLKALVEGLNPEKPFEPPPVIRNHPAMAHLNAMIGRQNRDPHKRLQRAIFGLKTKEVFGHA